ncbi:MAG: Rrf2 family transcriptional regulator [Balneolaceae bacterium]|nr:Rrf2 family transcriptional regulator [Balneolaceae bacterium]MBO6547083.1 Rrf2 family transcriptional regulator [Balneolaceae bacterium]MBO6647970.1 Rrf2 family transcriptional regulator [Balneolaceae bacterium]
MLLSKSCVYGLRASLFLAADNSGEYVSIKGMSEKLGISFHFLTKILQQLTADGIMESYKGPKGGVRLSKPAKDITFLEIVVSIDGEDLLRECVLGLPGCGSDKPCPLHDSWFETRTKIKEMFESTTLEYLAIEGKNNNLRISEDGKFDWI